MADSMQHDSVALLDDPVPMDSPSQGHHEAGFHTVVWDGRDGSGRELSSGVYLGLLQAGEHRRTERLTLVR